VIAATCPGLRVSRMTPTYFRSRADLRRWFATHHATTPELWAGFCKKGSGIPSVTYPEALDEALSVGWIDGVRKRVDDNRYVIRFTPRKPGSYWSAVNTKRANALKAEGRMTRAGLAVFEARDPERTKKYSFEREAAALPPELERAFRKNKTAWEFFQAQPPSYRRTLTWFVVSAKKEETRRARLDKLMQASAARKRLM
jgi:uncharacterized protein YdeI (YjbR/CyaY-like superfamily)